MRSIKSIASSMLCFLFMPTLMISLIIAINLGYLSGDTEVPDIVASVIQWRISANNFVLAFIIGMAICALVTIYANARKSNVIKATYLEKAFDFAGLLVANNFYFWAGNCLAYVLASNSLDFFHPVDFQGILIFVTLATGFAVEFFLALMKNLLLRPHLHSA